MSDGQALLRLGEALRLWAPPLQAAAIILGLPAVALYARRIAQHAGQSAHLAAATAEAAEAAKVSAVTSLQTLQELQAARQAEVAPYVIAYLDVTDERRICVVVKNIGRLPARDVAVGFDPPLVDPAQGTHTWEMPAFLSESIPFLPPQYELRSVLGDSDDLLDDSIAPQMEYQTHITYTDASTHGKHSDSYTLDLNVFRKMRLPHATTMSELQGLLDTLGEQQQTVVEKLTALQDTIASPRIAAGAEAIPELDPPAKGPGKDALTKESISEAHEAIAPRPASETPTPTDLASLCQQWQALGQRQRWETAGSLQRSLREMIRSSGMEESLDRASDSALTVSVNALLSHRFYLDGGESLRQFEAAVDCFLSGHRES